MRTRRGFACFDNVNIFTTVSVIARAVCAVGAKSRTFVSDSLGPRSLGYAEFRQLTDNMAPR